MSKLSDLGAAIDAKQAAIRAVQAKQGELYGQLEDLDDQLNVLQAQFLNARIDLQNAMDVGRTPRKHVQVPLTE